MFKFQSPLPHDVEAEEIAFRKAFASAMIKGNQVSPPAQKPLPVLGGSGAGLEGNPTRTVQTFESWVQTVGDFYRAKYPVDCVEWSPHVAQILNARALLDEFRSFSAVCQS